MSYIKKYYRNVIYISLIISILLAFISLIIPLIIDNYLYDKKIVYCYKYEENDKGINRLIPIIMFRDIKDKDDYLNYYKNYKNDTNTVFHFYPYLAPFYENAYILGYSEDSSVVKICYKSQLSKPILYFWVAREYIHKSPPNIEFKK